MARPAPKPAPPVLSKVPDRGNDPDADATLQALIEEQREKDRRRKEEERDELEDKLRPLEEVCKPARVGVTLMGYGSAASCAGAVFFFFFFVSALFAPGGIPALLALSGAVIGLHWLLTIVGFGFCIAGPKSMRPMAASGLVVMVLHAAVYIPLALTLARLISLDEVGFDSKGSRGGSIGPTLLLSNLFNNLTTVTDLSTYLMSDGVVAPAVLILPLIAGSLEFAKLSLMGILSNHYAVDAKAPELGHQTLRFVYRIFWLVIVGVVLKLGLWFLAKVLSGDPQLQTWFMMSVFMVTNAYLMWWGFSWYALYQTLLEIAEILTATRFADSRQRLETY
jgi:hypothetical protein